MCIWTDKHVGTQGEKKYNNYAQNIRHRHTKFSWLGNQVPWICAPLSTILKLSDDIIKTHFKILFKKLHYQIKCARADAHFQHCTNSKRHEDLWSFKLNTYNRHTIASILMNETCYTMLLIYSCTGVTQELVIFTHTTKYRQTLAYIHSESNGIFYLAITTNAGKPHRRNETPIWEVTYTPLYTFSYELSLLYTHTHTR